MRFAILSSGFASVLVLLAACSAPTVQNGSDAGTSSGNPAPPPVTPPNTPPVTPPNTPPPPPPPTSGSACTASLPPNTVCECDTACTSDCALGNCTMTCKSGEACTFKD